MNYLFCFVALRFIIADAAQVAPACLGSDSDFLTYKFFSTSAELTVELHSFKWLLYYFLSIANISMFSCFGWFPKSRFSAHREIFAKLRRFFRFTKLFIQLFCSFKISGLAWPALLLKSECKISIIYITGQIFHKQILPESKLKSVREPSNAISLTLLHRAKFLSVMLN